MAGQAEAAALRPEDCPPCRTNAGCLLLLRLHGRRGSLQLLWMLLLRRHGRRRALLLLLPLLLLLLPLLLLPLLLLLLPLLGSRQLVSGSQMLRNGLQRGDSRGGAGVARPRLQRLRHWGLRLRQLELLLSTRRRRRLSRLLVGRLALAPQLHGAWVVVLGSIQAAGKGRGGGAAQSVIQRPSACSQVVAAYSMQEQGAVQRQRAAPHPHAFAQRQACAPVLAPEGCVVGVAVGADLAVAVGGGGGHAAAGQRVVPRELPLLLLRAIRGGGIRGPMVAAAAARRCRSFPCRGGHWPAKRRRLRQTGP